MENTKQEFENIIKKILSYLDIDYSLDIQEINQDKPLLSAFIQTNQGAKFLIGKGGDSLRSLELVVRALLRAGPNLSISIDVNDYKKSKTTQLLNTVEAALAKVRGTNRALALEPMNPYERRIVHTTLAPHSDVMTESIGAGNQRRIVIKPQRGL